MRTFFLFAFLLLSFSFAAAQNVGVGTTQPSEKLEVSGVVFSNQGGIKFPDSTLQTTAAYNRTVEDAAENR